MRARHDVRPLLIRRTLIGALGFAAFMIFWSTIAYHLAHSSIAGDSRLAGMLGVIGLIVAPIVGRLAMKISVTKISMVTLTTIALAFLCFARGRESLVAPARRRAS